MLLPAEGGAASLDPNAFAPGQDDALSGLFSLDSLPSDNASWDNQPQPPSGTGSELGGGDPFLAPIAAINAPPTTPQLAATLVPEQSIESVAPVQWFASEFGGITGYN